jgi:hypothetical protein
MIERICPYCGKDFVARERRFLFCSRPCGWKGRKRREKKLAVWWTHKASGYIHGYVWRDGAKVRVKQHRVVVERAIGRTLLPTEDVHHLNGDKTDNRPENLQVIDHGAHSRITSAERDPLPRKSHCLNGHPFSGANLYVWRGNNYCRACRDARDRKRQPRRHRTVTLPRLPTLPVTLTETR